MKPELTFLRELFFTTKDSVVQSKIKERIRDLQRGYSSEDAREIMLIEKVKSGMNTVDDYRMIKDLCHE